MSKYHIKVIRKYYRYGSHLPLRLSSTVTTIHFVTNEEENAIFPVESFSYRFYFMLEQRYRLQHTDQRIRATETLQTPFSIVTGNF